MELPSELSGWNGFRYIVSQAELDGLHVPRRWCEFAATITKEDVEIWLTRFEAGVSNYVQTGGKVLPATDAVTGRMLRTLFLDPDVREAYAAAGHNWIRAEMLTDLSQEEDWEPSRTFLKKMVQKAAAAQMFSITNAGYTRQISDNLFFEVKIQSGDDILGGSQLHVENRVFSKSKGWQMFIPWSVILPGAEFYLNASTKCEASWAVKAQVSFSLFFIKSLQDSLRVNNVGS